MSDVVFVKKRETDTIWWVDAREYGVRGFSFDKEHIYNLFQDYPWKLTKEEKEIFDKENPYWANFFKSRSK